MDNSRHPSVPRFLHHCCEDSVLPHKALGDLLKERAAGQLGTAVVTLPQSTLLKLLRGPSAPEGPEPRLKSGCWGAKRPTCSSIEAGWARDTPGAQAILQGALPANSPPVFSWWDSKGCGKYPHPLQRWGLPLIIPCFWDRSRFVLSMNPV